MKKKMILIVILFFVVSFFVINGTLAIYRNTTNPNGNLILAKWDVSLNQSGIDDHISIIPGDATSTASYTVKITSVSEVDIIYTIKVEDLASGISVSLDGGNFVIPTDNKVIFNEIGTINYSDASKTKTHTLTFKADQNAQFSTDSEINVNVIARQRLAN